MKRKDKKGSLPVDTQIDIDYSGKEPKINFKYPDRNPERQNRSGYFSIVLFLIIVMVPLFIFTSYPLYELGPVEGCDLDWNNSNSSLYVYANCGELNYTFYSESVTTADYLLTGEKVIFNSYNRNNSFSRIIFGVILIMLVVISLILVFLLMNNFLTKFLVKNKWYVKNIPKINAFSLNGKLKYKKFTRRDIGEELILMIPSFDNVVLNFKASGDFGNNLLKISILPEDFKYKYYKKGKSIPKKWWTKRNWYTLFIFKEMPRKGKLEVWFQ